MKRVLVFLVAFCSISYGAPHPSKNDLGLSSWRVLQQADSFEILSIAPASGSLAEGIKAKIFHDQSFHDFKVLGRTSIPDAATRQKIILSLKKDLNEKLNRDHCFNPRRGLRAVKNGRTVDLVMSFECHYLYVFDGTTTRGLSTGNSLEPLLNTLLEQADIPTSP